MAQYISPGDAFTSALLEQQQAQQQQQVAAQRLGMEQERLKIDKAREDRMASFQQSEIQQRDEALRRQREEADVRSTDKKIAGFEKRVGDMFKGDIPDALLVKTADEIGQGHLFPPDPTTGHRTYVGSRREREDQKQRDDAMAFAQTLPPDSVQRKELEFFSKTGKTAPAGTFKDTTGGIRVNFNPRTGAYTAPGSTTPITDQSVLGGAKVERLQEPNPMAEQASADRKFKQANDIHEKAMTEVNKWATPYESQVKAVRDLGVTLKQASPAADSVVADLVYKSLVSGQGSGARMNNALIERIIGGRSAWQDFQAKLQKWATDPAAANSITADQRRQLRDLAQGIRDTVKSEMTKINKYRTDMDNALLAGDVAALIRARTTLQRELNEFDDETGEPGPRKNRSADDFLPKSKRD